MPFSTTKNGGHIMAKKRRRRFSREFKARVALAAMPVHREHEYSVLPLMEYGFYAAYVRIMSDQQKSV